MRLSWSARRPVIDPECDGIQGARPKQCAGSCRNLKGTMVIWHRKSEPPASITGTGDRAIDAMTGGAVPDALVEMKAISAFPRLGRGKMRLSL